MLSNPKILYNLKSIGLNTMIVIKVLTTHQVQKAFS